MRYSFLLMAFLLVVAFLMLESLLLPSGVMMRKFVPLSSSVKKSTPLASLRVLQYNILADGLSGLRADLGGFSKIDRGVLQWEKRKVKIMDELLQHKPDIINLQECDHFDDFFHPELLKRGYSGIFASKPSSACLQVSNRSDGCALFVNSNKLESITHEVVTYTLPHYDGIRTMFSHVLSRKKRLQNQVALVAVCRLRNDNFTSSFSQIPIIIANTHLKAAKTAQGERVRSEEMEQLLEAIDRMQCEVLSQHSNCNVSSVPVILAGDLNASPDKKSGPFGYESKVYPLIKRHPLRFRSVMNDDLPETVAEMEISSNSGEDEKTTDRKKMNHVWTSWKKRTRAGQEEVVKHCIDYIWYSTAKGHTPLSAVSVSTESAQGENRAAGDSGKKNIVYLRAVAALEAPTDESVGPEMLPSALYPSDHISLVADLEVMVEYKDTNLF